MKPPSHADLVSLAELPEYRVCAEDTDPRGWPVVDCAKVAVGKITDLIVDLQGQTARYVVCATTGADARAVLVPTGFARLDTEECTVHLDFVTAADLAKLPTFTGLPLSAEHSARLAEVLTGAASTASPSPKVVRRNSEAS
jgi:hypothetical protein